MGMFSWLWPKYALDDLKKAEVLPSKSWQDSLETVAENERKQREAYEKLTIGEPTLSLLQELLKDDVWVQQSDNCKIVTVQHKLHKDVSVSIICFGFGVTQLTGLSWMNAKESDLVKRAVEALIYRLQEETARKAQEFSRNRFMVLVKEPQSC